ncbi:hypothetical protein [Kocuria sp. NPDC057446]|uniref:hypothetical protein n=1 Tax=Kocuria sp. NPDC057446 TaxID=3346137 RepID=UPI0036B78E84
MTEPDRAWHELLTGILLREGVGAAVFGTLLGLLLGLALPVGEWAGLGWGAPVVLGAALLPRRLVTLWTLRPLLRGVHDRSETFFLSWFGPIGVSALFYATPTERHTGNHDVFVHTTLAITLSVLVHGLSTAPLSAWLQHREPEREQEEESPA